MSRTEMPWMWIIGGPNGAGKTTLAKAILGEVLDTAIFLNADEMARELEGFDARNILAGRMLIEAVEASIAARRSFAVETTLSSRRYLRVARSIRAGWTLGNNFWRVGLLYVGLDRADLAVSRVARRVASGGHDIPEIDIRRRFTRSCGLLPEYMECVDRCLVFDNSGETPHLLLDHRGPGSPNQISPFPWETRND